MINRLFTPLIVAGLGLLLVVSGCSGTAKTSNISCSPEPHRPCFHFTPDSMWMNDPNGLVYFDGEYHLFYQYYPDSTVWGPMHWGHAVSSDLVHWQHLPVALYPDSLGYIFSGSAVVDTDNTSGFGKPGQPAMVAIFTYHDMKAEKAGKTDYQSQGIAYSTDRGRNWTKYPGNPVIKNPGKRDFRDPKVAWNKESSRWIMTLAAGDRVIFYSSADLKDWKLESEFGQGTGAHGGVWECPDLIEMPVAGKPGEKKWVLLVSINPGGPNRGSATQYFVGKFDGHVFSNESTELRWVDYGKDNYAGVTFSNIPEQDGRVISIGWMSNWQYAQVVPTTTWRSAMTFPRQMKLLEKNGHYLLTSTPVAEIQQLREEKTELEPHTVNGVTDINPALFTPLLPLELNLEFENPNVVTGAFGMILSNDKGEYIRIGYEAAGKRFFIDRQHSGKGDFSSDFSGIHYSAPCILDKKVKLQLLIDVASVELFVNEGEVVMTDIFFPEDYYDTLKLFAEGVSVNLMSGNAYKLNGSILEK